MSRKRSSSSSSSAPKRATPECERCNNALTDLKPVVCNACGSKVCSGCSMAAEQWDSGECKRWTLCSDCDVCCLCGWQLGGRGGLARRIKDPVIACDVRSDDGPSHYRFACGNEDLADTAVVAGCGARCFRCGIVPLKDVVYKQEDTCDNVFLCVHHDDIECSICKRTGLRDKLLRLYLGNVACPDCAVWCAGCHSAHPKSSSCAGDRSKSPNAYKRWYQWTKITRQLMEK